MVLRPLQKLGGDSPLVSTPCKNSIYYITYIMLKLFFFWPVVVIFLMVSLIPRKHKFPTKSIRTCGFFSYFLGCQQVYMTFAREGLDNGYEDGCVLLVFHSVI